MFDERSAPLLANGMQYSATTTSIEVTICHILLRAKEVKTFHRHAEDCWIFLFARTDRGLSHCPVLTVARIIRHIANDDIHLYLASAAVIVVVNCDFWWPIWLSDEPLSKNALIRDISEDKDLILQRPNRRPVIRVSRVLIHPALTPLPLRLAAGEWRCLYKLQRLFCLYLLPFLPAYLSTCLLTCLCLPPVVISNTGYVTEHASYQAVTVIFVLRWPTRLRSVNGLGMK